MLNEFKLFFCISPLVDINECLNGTHHCLGLATCVNTKSSYICLCQLGYTGDGKTQCESEFVTESLIDAYRNSCLLNSSDIPGAFGGKTSIYYVGFA